MDSEKVKTQKITPIPEFQEVFSHFYWAKNFGNTAVRQTLVPSYQTIMVFTFGNSLIIHHSAQDVVIRKCVVLGPVKRAFDYSLDGQSSILVINFKQDAFYRFFNRVLGNAPLTHPDTLVPENCFTDLWEKLTHIPEVQEKIAYLLTYCRPFLKDRNEIFEQLRKVDGEGADPIKSVSSARQQSMRHIQRTHKKYLGYSAKEWARYQWFSKALQLLNHLLNDEKTIDWFALIEQCGYYDQSHLIRDFQHYLSLSPTTYVKLQDEICMPNT